MKIQGILFFIGFSVLIIACGKSDEEKAVENAQKSLSESMGEAQKQLENMANGKEVEVINFRELRELLPKSVDGYNQVDLSGSTAGNLGFKVSNVQAQYEGPGDVEIDVDLVDAGGLGQATMALAAWSMTTIDKEDSNGYERTGEFMGYKSYEKHFSNFNRSEISIFIENRLVLTAKANDLDMEGLKKFLRSINIDKFKSLL